jgi:hypothetical protein
MRTRSLAHQPLSTNRLLTVGLALLLLFASTGCGRRVTDEPGAPADIPSPSPSTAPAGWGMMPSAPIGEEPRTGPERRCHIPAELVDGIWGRHGRRADDVTGINAPRQPA